VNVPSQVRHRHEHAEEREEQAGTGSDADYERVAHSISAAVGYQGDDQDAAAGVGSI